MIDSSSKSYSGKLLLFGEYTTIRGSKALAIPLASFKGQWKQAQTTDKEIPSLIDFINYIEANSWGVEIDVNRFRKETDNGLYFESNIPIGYGVGSSGALCAAVYERYAYAPLHAEDSAHYEALKKMLAQLESYFHGSSSGTDPLICYLNKPALLQPSGQISVPVLSDNAKQKGTFFLIDTEISRKTAPLVETFMKKCKNADFVKLLASDLIPYNEQAIDDYLQGKRTALAIAMKAISRFQLQHFRAMIPNAFITLWENGLSSNNYSLKLCGAGGGGFILGYTPQALEEIDWPPGLKMIPLDNV